MEELIHIREARQEDIPHVVSLLIDDPIGAVREDASGDGLKKYEATFQAMRKNRSCRLFIAEHDGEVLGCLQVNILEGLSYQATRRCILEDMRVRKDRRGLGIGRTLVDAALAFAKNERCELAELFVHQDRNQAHRFYEACGFTNVHRGFRKTLQ